MTNHKLPELENYDLKLFDKSIHKDSEQIFIFLNLDFFL